PDVVAQMRVELIKQLQCFGSGVTEQVLTAVAAVAYRGDVDAYVLEAVHVSTVATKRAIQPLIEKLEAECAANVERNKELEAQLEQFQREFEQFRHMRTPETIQ